MAFNKLEKLKEEIINCSKCMLRKNSKPLPGEGSIDSRIMIIGLSPSNHRGQNRILFGGENERNIDEIFKYIGISKNFLYITNLIKCAITDRKPTKEQVLKCWPYLDQEIEIVDPSVIAPIGFFITEYIFRKYGIKIHSNEKMFKNLLVTENIKILPLRHPYINKGIPEEYNKLKVLLKDCKWFNVCPMHRFYKQGKLDGKWIERYCKGDWSSCIRYKMEERGEYHPDHMLPDGTIKKELKN